MRAHILSVSDCLSVGLYLFLSVSLPAAQFPRMPPSASSAPLWLSKPKQCHRPRTNKAIQHQHQQQQQYLQGLPALPAPSAPPAAAAAVLRRVLIAPRWRCHWRPSFFGFSSTAIRCCVATSTPPPPSYSRSHASLASCLSWFSAAAFGTRSLCVCRSRSSTLQYPASCSVQSRLHLTPLLLSPRHPLVYSCPNQPTFLPIPTVTGLADAEAPCV